MASFINVRRFSKPSAQAVGIGMSTYAWLVSLPAAFSNAAVGAFVATFELATPQRNELVPVDVLRPARARSLAGSRPSSGRSSW
jgi:hypothetical protein